MLAPREEGWSADEFDPYARPKVRDWREMLEVVKDVNARMGGKDLRQRV
jgi:hypothetical protein